MKDVLFVLYAAAIPLVPLWGAKHYGKTDAKAKRYVCIGLFFAQTLLSLGCILTYLGLA